MEYADPKKRGHGTVPVQTYRGREIYRTADRTLVIPPAGHAYCVDNLREGDEGPTLHTEVSIEACREFIADEETEALATLMSHTADVCEAWMSGRAGLLDFGQTASLLRAAASSLRGF